MASGAPMKFSGLQRYTCALFFSVCRLPFFIMLWRAALRSVGDAKTPVYFLAAGFGFECRIGFAVCCRVSLGRRGSGTGDRDCGGGVGLLCVCYIRRRVPSLRLGREDMGVDGELLKLTIQQGSITALQQCCPAHRQAFDSGKNQYAGVSTIAAFNAVSRVDDFAFTPEQSIASAIMTFVAQNRGAGKRERVRNGFRIGLLLEAGLLAAHLYSGAVRTAGS